MSVKKLVPTVGFGKRKDSGQIASLGNEINTNKDSNKIIEDGTKQGDNQDGVETSDLSSTLDTQQDTTLITSQDDSHSNLLCDANETTDEPLQNTVQDSDKQEFVPNIPLIESKEVTTKDTILSSNLDIAESIILSRLQSSNIISDINSTLDSSLDPTLPTEQNIVQNTMDNTSNHSIVDTMQQSTKLIYQIPSKGEKYNKRLVANVTQSQKTFVQEMSKKFSNESEFVRFMIDRFMSDDIALKENE